MTHDPILNIGLLAGDVEILPTAIYKALRQLGIRWMFSTKSDSDTEPTQVVELTGEVMDIQIHALADVLDQECIAVWDRYHQEGRLIGPQAAKWGDFNPALFIMPNGRRLAGEQL